VAWVLPVPDPRRFGVAEVGEDGWVKHFIEKPTSMDNNLVVIGCYYFKSGDQLLEAIEEQMERNLSLKGEFFLTDTITLMIEKGARVRTQVSGSWLDTGTIDATLETNKILLESGSANVTRDEQRGSVQILAPSFVHPSAEISEAVIGPFVSIGPGCKISQAVIQQSIIEAGTEIKRTALTHSLIGRNCLVEGQPNQEEAMSLNIGDNSSVVSK
jgi:glucose-1-phosphate thymidylyltransferase